MLISSAFDSGIRISLEKLGLNALVKELITKLYNNSYFKKKGGGSAPPIFLYLSYIFSEFGHYL